MKKTMNDENSEEGPIHKQQNQKREQDKEPRITIKQAFGIGALGGMAPAMARGVGYLLSHGGEMPPLGRGQILGYAFALILMLVLGGLLAVFTDDAAARTLKSAFGLGLSLPSLFQLGFLQADAPKHTTDISRPFQVAFIASACAGDQDMRPTSESAAVNGAEDALVSRRKLEVSTPNTSISKDVSATFLDTSGNRISSTVVQPGFAAVNVPAQAAAVRFEKNGSASESHPLSNKAVQTAEVKIEQKPVSAFVQAIGLSREAKPSIQVAKVAGAQKLPVGTYGWCYLGDRGADGWRTRYVDFPGQDVPQAGSIVTVNFPLNVRPSVESSAVIGVAHAAQRLRIEETKNLNNLYWAAVTVVE
jgi:hypothetical protein